MAKAEQGLLFSDEECKQLQSIILSNYQDRVQKSVNIVIEDEEDVFLDTETVNHKGILQDDLFDVDAIEAVHNDMKQQQHEIAIKEAQKHMELPYFEHPKSDNELLLNYQHDFIKNNDKNAWGMLLSLAFEVTKRLIWAWLKEHRDVYLDDIGQDEKASIAMEYVLRRYSKNVGWYVKKNYIGALKGGVIHAMKYISKIDEMTDVYENVNLERSKHQIS